jgi:hypothetical protein
VQATQIELASSLPNEQEVFSTMKLRMFALSIFALSLGIAFPISVKAYAAPQEPAPSGYQQVQGGWDAPPEEFREIQRQGFHDGIEGARKDFDHHRMPDVNNRDEYRHPHVPPSAREDYREGFRRGYDVAMHHLTGGEAGL